MFVALPLMNSWRLVVFSYRQVLGQHCTVLTEHLQGSGNTRVKQWCKGLCDKRPPRGVQNGSSGWNCGQRPLGKQDVSWTVRAE